jgi:hypothetical protein
MNAKRGRLVPGLAWLACLVFSATQHSVAAAQTVAAPAKEKPFVVEYYYKTRWGFADEFLRLFKKNHYPLLMKEKELGRILKVTAAKPMDHATEDGRWDYRVTIVWKNIQVTVDDFDEEGLIKQLYPDQETFRKEEQRRFEILLAHWDLPIEDVDLNK